MNRLGYDIETTGQDFDSLDQKQQEYWLKWAGSDEEATELKTQTSFYPLTGQVVSIASLDPGTQKSEVYTIGKEKGIDEGNTKYLFFPDEKSVLTKFWEIAKNYHQFITFNGRTFDAPYLIIRSAINKIRPPIDLLGYRYKSIPHLDLADQFAFFGAIRRHFPLHFYCKAFSIDSPKNKGITGEDIPKLFKAGKSLTIARYCLLDVIATAKLLEYWDKYLSSDNIYT